MRTYVDSRREATSGGPILCLTSKQPECARNSWQPTRWVGVASGFLGAIMSSLVRPAERVSDPGWNSFLGKARVLRYTRVGGRVDNSHEASLSIFLYGVHDIFRVFFFAICHLLIF